MALARIIVWRNGVVHQTCCFECYGIFFYILPTIGLLLWNPYIPIVIGLVYILIIFGLWGLVTSNGQDWWDLHVKSTYIFWGSLVQKKADLLICYSPLGLLTSQSSGGSPTRTSPYIMIMRTILFAMSMIIVKTLAIMTCYLVHHQASIHRGLPQVRWFGLK